MKPWVIALLALCCTTLCYTTAARAEQTRNDLGWILNVNATSGGYQIDSKAPDWAVGGSVGIPLAYVVSAEGQDNIGDFREISFRGKQEAQRHGSIRLYRTRPCVLFRVTFDEAVNGSPAPFPVLDKLPKSLMEFRLGDQDHLRPPTFKFAPATESDQYGGPFALFDADANTMILSPADNFMIAMLSGDQKTGLRSGFNRTLQSVPAGYTHQTLLTIDHGINHTWDAWGQALTTLHGKHRPANDADAGLKYLSYWTDNGAYYYYNYDLDKGYQGTLLALKDHFERAHIPVRTMQLDSWWYPKTFNSIQPDARDKKRSKNPQIPEGTWNRYGGMLQYTAHPDLFPGGLGEFHNRIGMPLITHSRWIDPESPYHQSYKISGVAAVDPAFWKDIIGNIADWGVATYEQDWLNHIYLQSPELFSTTEAGDAFMDGMAAACASRGVTMQYCMVLARHVMQGGAKYSNLTTVRVSGDRLNRGKWREFVYGSRLASALGIWPSSDCYKSSETPNILISTLFGGMVGLSDKLGEENTENIFRAVRKDGVIIKPDVPLLPDDATFIAEARGNGSTVVCTTRTEHNESSAGRAAYVFAFQPKTSDDPQTRQWILSPRDEGINGACFAYDYFAARGQLIQAGQPLSSKIDGKGWNYQVLCPVGPSGIALIGDVGSFVTRGKKRIAEIDDQPSELRSKVLFAKGEEVLTIAAYATAKPTVVVQGGVCKEVSYDSKTRIALARIAVDAASSPVVVDGDPVKPVDVTFRTRPRQ